MQTAAFLYQELLRCAITDPQEFAKFVTSTDAASAQFITVMSALTGYPPDKLRALANEFLNKNVEANNDFIASMIGAYLGNDSPLYKQAIKAKDTGIGILDDPLFNALTLGRGTGLSKLFTAGGRLAVLEGGEILVTQLSKGAIDDLLREGLIIARADGTYIVNKAVAIGCFVAGTLVATETGLRPIEEIKVGDLVHSRDSRTGKTALKPIVRLIRHHGQQIFKVTLVSSAHHIETIGATSEHPFYVTKKGWVGVSQLRAGMVVQQLDGTGLTVRAVVRERQLQDTFNFEVQDFHTYFVGKKSAWVHNDCGLGGFKVSLTVEEIMAINRSFGGSVAYRDISTIFSNAEMYDGFVNKIAVVIRDIAGAHLFNDGNKRTAMEVVEQLIIRNGVDAPPQAVISSVISRVGRGELKDVADIAKALRGG